MKEAKPLYLVSFSLVSEVGTAEVVDSTAGLAQGMYFAAYRVMFRVYLHILMHQGKCKPVFFVRWKPSDFTVLARVSGLRRLVDCQILALSSQSLLVKVCSYSDQEPPVYYRGSEDKKRRVQVAPHQGVEP